ncbi:MAG: phytoene/squalene synthase family protein [Elusimicrobiota bacterium]
MQPSTNEQLLKSVSRSLFLSFKILPSHIKPAMSIAYLLCRAADTIADTDLLSQEERLSYLKNFKDCFKSFPLSLPDQIIFSEKIKNAVLGEKTSEEILLKSLEQCFRALHCLSQTEKTLIQKVVLAVTTGMTNDLNDFKNGTKENPQSLQTSHQLENYIGLIGGEPGRFWLSLFLFHDHKKIKNSDKWIQQGFKFGTGLQLINILRDLPEDLNRGRCYIPDSLLKDYQLKPNELLPNEKSSQFRTLFHFMIDETLTRMELGMDCLEMIPFWQIRLRLSIWLPLWIGMKTLARLRIENNIFIGKPIKIGRNKIKKGILNSLFKIPFNNLLRKEFTNLKNEASSKMIC